MTQAVRIALIGAAGRMGKTIINLAKDDPNIDIVAKCDLDDPIEPAMKSCDMAIDFSQAGTIDEICRTAVAHRRAPLLRPTLLANEPRAMLQAASPTMADG